MSTGLILPRFYRKVVAMSACPQASSMIHNPPLPLIHVMCLRNRIISYRFDHLLYTLILLQFVMGSHNQRCRLVGMVSNEGSQLRQVICDSIISCYYQLILLLYVGGGCPVLLETMRTGGRKFLDQRSILLIN